ncbi:MAG: fibrillarin-like rRNA/tRNA 2'-O-methyltransferase [Candidatus Altiarchaeota archaeon]|nr:fibrillarin-like rRNA/tRNA 2'-O-methyltransferase [Candidatus Altiarchaeota archaeon]
MSMRHVFPGVYRSGSEIATLNSTPGYRVYGEKVFKDKNKEYRIWDPFRSKVAAAILKGLKDFPVTPDSNVLYLGASSGTTASHIADVTSGQVYCVEFSSTMMRDLMLVCDRKKNMVPILGDARHPWEYDSLVAKADVLIQDVAQPDQASILSSNAEYYGIKKALLSIKARSINSIKSPKEVFEEELKKISEKFKIMQKLDLMPYDEDHMLVNLEAKSV